MARPLDLTGEKHRCLNLGSYNYLGFASSDEYCTPRVLDTLKRFGWGTSSSRSEAGVKSVGKQSCKQFDNLRALFLSQ